MHYSAGRGFDRRLTKKKPSVFICNLPLFDGCMALELMLWGSAASFIINACIVAYRVVGTLWFPSVSIFPHRIGESCIRWTSAKDEPLSDWLQGVKMDDHVMLL